MALSSLESAALRLSIARNDSTIKVYRFQFHCEPTNSCRMLWSLSEPPGMKIFCSRAFVASLAERFKKRSMKLPLCKQIKVSDCNV